MPTVSDIARFSRRTHAERLACAHARRARDLNGGRWAGYWSARQWQDLLAEWDYTCAYCHRSFPPDKLTPDHRIPLVRGGKNALWNLLPACARCNSQKGVRTEAEYRAYLATKEAKKPMTIQTLTADVHDNAAASACRPLPGRDRCRSGRARAAPRSLRPPNAHCQASGSANGQHPWLANLRQAHSDQAASKRRR